MAGTTPDLTRHRTAAHQHHRLAAIHRLPVGYPPPSGGYPPPGGGTTPPTAPSPMPPMGGGYRRTSSPGDTPGARTRMPASRNADARRPAAVRPVGVAAVRLADPRAGVHPARSLAGSAAPATRRTASSAGPAAPHDGQRRPATGRVGFLAGGCSAGGPTGRRGRHPARRVRQPCTCPADRDHRHHRGVADHRFRPGRPYNHRGHQPGRDRFAARRRSGQRSKESSQFARANDAKKLFDDNPITFWAPKRTADPGPRRVVEATFSRRSAG